MNRNSPPIRIALIASSLKLAGAEKQTVYLARALLEAGTHLRFFHLGAGGHYEGVLRRMGISFTRIYRRNRPVLMLARLLVALGRFRPQIVFAPQFGDLLQAGISGRLCNALTLGGLRSDGFYELEAHGPRSQGMLWLAHGLVANSYRARQNLATRGIDASKIRILPNGLDLEEFDVRSVAPPPFSPPPRRVAAVAVGSLQPSKRFDRFLKALALARQRAPGLFGVVAGRDCGSGRVLVREAEELGLLPSHLLFLGECHNVPALLVRAGFLVVSSEYEGFPNVILEAMAARLPVISTPVGDADRIILPDQTGYLVQKPDIEGLADRMVALAGDARTRTRLGIQGRKRVARYFNYQDLPSRLLSVFKDFASTNRRHRLKASLQAQLSNGKDAGPIPLRRNIVPVFLPQPIQGK